MGGEGESLSELAKVQGRNLLLKALKSEENSAAIGKVLQGLFQRDGVQAGVRSAVQQGLRSQDIFDGADYQAKWWLKYYSNPAAGGTDYFNWTVNWLGGPNGMIEWWLLHPVSISSTIRPNLMWSISQDWFVKRQAINSAYNIPFNIDYTVDTIKYNVIEILKSSETRKQSTALLIKQLQERS